MKSTYLNYLRKLLLFSGILGSIVLILMLFVPTSFISPALPFLFVFFIATSLLSFHYLLNSAAKRFIVFVNTFLLTIVVKLFLYAAVMVAYALLNRSDAIRFMLVFFILYLCYTIFEAVSIIRVTQQSRSDKID